MDTDRQIAGASDNAGAYHVPRRHLASLAGSIIAHAALVVAIVYFAPRVPVRAHEWVTAYVINLGDGHDAPSAGSAGGAVAGSLDPGFAALPDLPAAPRPRANRKPAHHRTESVAETPPPASHDDLACGSSSRVGLQCADSGASTGASHDTAARASGSGAGSSTGRAGARGGGSLGNGAGSGSGTGAGAGGATSVAQADYGSSPPPPYPVRSRRRAEQGTVTLRVLVGADGAVQRVELAMSSGFRRLDGAAMETVRTRWRFMPARRDGIAVESWVIVPIRFALTEASAAN